MTDKDPPVSLRAATGRFVKRTPEAEPAAPVNPDAGIHPMSRILFGWTYGRGTGALIFWGLGLLSAALIAADLVIGRKDYFAFAEATGFYGLFGFAAFAFVVLAGWPLGMLLRRSVHLYAKDSALPRHLDPDLDAAPAAPAKAGKP